MSEPVMIFNISIDRSQISDLVSENGKVKIIPFTGKVESELFTGTVLPGAADIQVTNRAGIRHMKARYMFSGVDSEGRRCKLFVDNNGYFEPNSQPKPFHACPEFMTDSPVLAEYLHGPYFRREGHSNENGVDIKIFDIRK